MLAMEWLLAPSTSIRAAEQGLPADPLGAYAVGRLGVLGDCPPDNVVAAAYFWEPGYMRGMVERGRAVTDPADGARTYAKICQEWGEATLSDFDGYEPLGKLVEKVVANASPYGAPTFVGWREQELPKAGPGRTFQLCQTMRELRFGRHTVAVQALGMSPLEAILSGPTGDWNAKFFGWPEPFPSTDHLSEVRDEIESLTDKLHAQDIAILSDQERSDLRNLAKAARVHAADKSSGQRPDEMVN